MWYNIIVKAIRHTGKEMCDLAKKKTRKTRQQLNQEARRKRKRKRTFKKVMDRMAAIIVFGGFCAAVGYPIVTGMVSINPLTGKENISAVNSADDNNESASEPTEASTDSSYNTVSIKNTEIYRGPLILVNSEHAFESAKDAKIKALFDEKTDSYSVSGMDISLQEEAIEPLNNMLDAFARDTGHSDILIVAGFRTLEQQQALYDADLEKTGLTTSTLVAIPGHSEHETGYALDFSLFFSDGTSGEYDGTGDYDWIDKNCADYGYILRYPADKTEITGIQHESWHYRYVGKPHAYYIMQSGMCYEEYIEKLKNYTPEEPLEIVDGDGKAYVVYYVPAEMDKTVTYVPLISDKPYTISGNNFDGFIITIDLQETRELVSYTKPVEEVTGITTDEYGNVVTTVSGESASTTTTVYAVG